MKRNLIIVSLSIAAFTLSACGGGGMSIPKMPVEEAQALNASLSGDYQNTKTTWDNAQASAGTVGEATGVDVNALKIDEFKGMMTECFAAPIETVEEVAAEAGETATDAAELKNQSAAKDANQGALAAKSGYEKVKNCGPATEDSVAAYKADGNEQTSEFYVAKMTMVDNLRKDLLYILPTNVENLTKRSPEALTEAAEIRANAEAAKAAVDTNPLASAEQKAKAKTDYETVIAELDSVEATAKAIPAEFASMPADMVTLGQKVSTDIQNFGQVPSDS